MSPYTASAEITFWRISSPKVFRFLENRFSSNARCLFDVRSCFLTRQAYRQERQAEPILRSRVNWCRDPRPVPNGQSGRVRRTFGSSPLTRWPRLSRLHQRPPLCSW